MCLILNHFFVSMNASPQATFFMTIQYIEKGRVNNTTVTSDIIPCMYYPPRTWPLPQDCLIVVAATFREKANSNIFFSSLLILQAFQDFLYQYHHYTYSSINPRNSSISNKYFKKLSFYLSINFQDYLQQYHHSIYTYLLILELHL